MPKADVKTKRCASAAAYTVALVQAPDVIAIKAFRLQLGTLGNNSPCSRSHGGTLFIRNDRGDLGNEASATLESHVTPQPGHGDDETIPKANQKIDVHCAPKYPANKALELNRTEFYDGSGRSMLVSS